MASSFETSSDNVLAYEKQFDGNKDVMEILEQINKISSVRTPPKLYRIGEVVEFSGFSRQTIHNYTAMGLIRESKWTNSGHRLYEEDVFHRLEAIKRLKSNYSLLKIKEAFDLKDSIASQSVG